MTRQDFRGFYKSQHPDGGLFVDLATLSRVMGMDAKHMRQIICELGIEYYRPAARKLYNVEDVFVQVSQTRYRQ